MGADAGPDVMTGYPEYAAGVGRTWALQRADGTTADVVLSSCVPHREARSTGFTLTFVHPPGDAVLLEQDTYLVSHDGADASPVFLVPVAQSAAGTELQAVFNHLVPDREAVS